MKIYNMSTSIKQWNLMPPKYVKTVSDVINFYSWLVIARAANKMTEWGFITYQYNRLKKGQIKWADFDGDFIAIWQSWKVLDRSGPWQSFPTRNWSCANHDWVVYVPDSGVRTLGSGALALPVKQTVTYCIIFVFLRVKNASPSWILWGRPTRNTTLRKSLQL